MDINTELRNHLICEFLTRKLAPSLLIETRGVINGIDEVIDAFMSVIEQQVESTFNGTNTTISQTYNNEDIIAGIKTFFKEFNIKITTKRSSKNAVNGGTSPSSIRLGEDSWYCVPQINIIVEGTNVNTMYKKIQYSIGHELTHCFNLLQYAIQNNKHPMSNINRQHYFDIINSKDNGIGNERAVASVLYVLNRMERNAYIGQLRQELLSVKNKMTDDKAIFELIKSTESYKKFMYLETQISIFNEVSNENLQKKIINWVNEMMDKSFTNYNQVKKYLNNRWNKWKKSYLSKATKIAYDIYATTDYSKWFDWGMMEDLPELKI